MKRIVVIVCCVAVACAAVAGVVVLALDDGPTAARVGDVEVAQDSFDDELRVIAENETLRDAVTAAQAPALSNSEGSVTTSVGSGWLGLVIAQELAARAVERRDLQASPRDADRSRALAIQSVGNKRIFASLPAWFRDRLVRRWTPVAVLERRVKEQPPPALLDALARQCPSGRYVAHILVESEAEALTVKAQLDAGADFADLARQRSTDTASARNGGELGCADGQSFAEPFATVAATQPVGVVSDPVTTQYGSHLILVRDQPPASLLSQFATQAVLQGGRGVAGEVDPRYGIWDTSTGQVIAPPVPSPPAPSAPAPAPVG